MNDKSSLYVFAKKEVALIFLFMFVIAITSFVLGVKLGKEHAYSEGLVEREDRSRVDMLSGEEERAAGAMEQLRKKGGKAKVEAAEEDIIHKRLQQHIHAELEGGKPVAEKDFSAKLEEAAKELPLGEVPAQEPPGEEGKYTIQLSSHRSRSEAEHFAKGFEVRGYRPLIREVTLPAKGVWFRVSLGRFQTIKEAKEYIVKEKSLFKDEDHHIASLENRP